MTSTKSNWHVFVAENIVTLELLTGLRTICQFQIPESWSHENCHLSVIHALYRNTWRLLNFIDIFYCKKLSDTLILNTTSHNLSFRNPWELVHVNRSQNFAQSVNLKFLEVSALENCEQYVIWNLDGRSWRILILIDMICCDKIRDTWIASGLRTICQFGIPRC